MLLDLLFLALLVFFIFYRLFSVLGKRTDIERKSASWEDIFSNPLKKDPSSKDQKKKSASIKEAHFEVTENGVKGGQRTLDHLKKIDPSFTVSAFLEGAQTAFDLILHAYAQGDLSSVESFVDPAVQQSFSTEINKRGSKNYSLDLHELRAEIIQAHLNPSTAVLDVRFLSEQKWSESDPSDPTHRHEEVLACTDIWSFERPLKSKDPNWILIATNEENSAQPSDE